MERQRGVASPEGADQVESSAPAPGAEVPRPAVVCGQRPRGSGGTGRPGHMRMAGSGPRPRGSGRPTRDGPSGGDAEDRGGVQRCRSAMAEWSVAGTERDVLLATKLYLPGPRPGQVSRPRLMTRLDEGLARGLILACAPAGYGKTVLLADWTRRGESPGCLAVAGRGGQRPGPVLAARGGRARPGSPRDRRAGGAAARSARAVVVPGPGHGADQRPGRGSRPCWSSTITT